MLIENGFTVVTPVKQLWAFLLDVERIAPCLPGAELTEAVDDSTWKGLVHLKFGPVAMSFAGTVELAERDDATHRAVLKAKGMEQKGRGAATAVVTAWLEPADEDRTTVRMSADVTLSGPAAQLSRGLLPEISKRLTQQFADCLEASIAAREPERRAAVQVAGADEPATAPAPAASRPVGGVQLGVRAIWSLIVGWFRRVFGRRGSPSA